MLRIVDIRFSCYSKAVRSSFNRSHRDSVFKVVRHFELIYDAIVSHLSFSSEEEQSDYIRVETIKKLIEEKLGTAFAYDLSLV